MESNKTKKVVKASFIGLSSLLMVLLMPVMAFASEADLKIPKSVRFTKQFTVCRYSCLFIGYGIWVLSIP